MTDLAREIIGTQPILTAFLAIGLGYLVGQISIGSFSLGVGAVLFVGLALGAIAPKAQITGPIGLIGLIMFLYGVVWVSLILNYLTEVRRLPVMGEPVQVHDQHFGVASPAIATQSAEPGMSQTARLISDEAARLYDAMHGLIPRLAPPSLDSQGLAESPETLVRDWQGRHPSPRLALQHQLLPDLGTSVTLAAYRVVQEGLVNAVRHARAQQVAIEVTAVDGRLIASVTDDGVGLPENWSRQRNPRATFSAKSSPRTTQLHNSDDIWCLLIGAWQNHEIRHIPLTKYLPRRKAAPQELPFCGAAGRLLGLAEGALALCESQPR